MAPRSETTTRRVTLTAQERLAAERARELVVFCDGISDLAPDLARRSRIVASDIADLITMLKSERSARVSIQEARDRLTKLHFPGAA